MTSPIDLETRLGHTFADPARLRRALTHSSYANERAENGRDNERLEFLGDAVLELAVSHELHARFPLAREGHLTRIRSRLVKEPTLAVIARELGLQEDLLLGRGEDTQGGRERDALLADALEAVIGAVFLDAGYEAARGVVLRLFQGHWPENFELPRVKDYKTRLQEVTQQMFRDRPVYVQVDVEGPDHARIYRVEVALPGGATCLGQGPSLKKAEQNAAKKALDAIAGPGRASRTP